MQRPTLFFCCAPADRDHRATLEKHLAGLFRKRFRPWSEDDVLAGTEHEAAIARALDRATVIVLLVSADLLASPRHQRAELNRALVRHERGEALVIPVILRACTWESEPFAKLQALPRERSASPGRVPVLSTDNTDEAFAEVAAEIWKAAEAFTPAPSAAVADSGADARPSAAVADSEAIPPRSTPAAEAPLAPARGGPALGPKGPQPPPRSPGSRKALAIGVAVVVLVIAAGGLLLGYLSFGPTPGSGPQVQTVSGLSTPPLPATVRTPGAPPSASAPPDSTTSFSGATSDPPPPARPSAVPAPSAPTTAPPVTTTSLSTPGLASSSSASTSADPTAARLPVVTTGSASCKGTLCTLAARGARVTASHFCLSAPASAPELEDLTPTCSGRQSTPGADIRCVRTGQAASIPLKGSIAWTICP